MMNVLAVSSLLNLYALTFVVVFWRCSLPWFSERLKEADLGFNPSRKAWSRNGKLEEWTDAGSGCKV